MDPGRPPTDAVARVVPPARFTERRDVSVLPAPMLRWARDGVGPWPVLPWLVISAIAPVSDTLARRSVLGALILLVHVAGFFVTVLPAGRGESVRRVVGVPVVVALAALTVAAAGAWGDDWRTLLVLVAIEAGTGLDVGTAPVLVAAVTAAAVLSSGLGGGDWGTAWILGLNCFLAGIAAYLVYWLFTAVHELSRTREELASAAVSRERLRFARDLHDVLGHTLSIVVVKAEAVRRIALRDPEAAAAHASDIEAIGRSALAEVRDTVGGYRRTTWQEEVTSAHVALAAAGVALDVRGHTDDLDPAVADVLVWVLREATTNVVRHAQASRCSVAVCRTDDAVTMTVADDGRGSADGDGHGLTGARERASSARGTLRTTSDFNGFRVEVTLPADRAETR
ncbi:sensor histidine kinase [Luteipulveratus flavus]|uniref:Sensor histidine kinase n=1 Tax=Luteipulveratus flavus TaxID=3031728 RepID=A0ABT6C8K9_9MICO|nr:sensor histidine kinase [Luteipulveratus sp. YIM 133296]MDF8265264.1 sensor histidine kinase [Luteipulveratus sp. YIM 133296]